MLPCGSYLDRMVGVHLAKGAHRTDPPDRLETQGPWPIRPVREGGRRHWREDRHPDRRPVRTDWLGKGVKEPDRTSVQEAGYLPR